MISSSDKMDAQAYGHTRSFFASWVSPLLVNKHLPAGMYATATRREIGEAKLNLVRELAEL